MHRRGIYTALTVTTVSSSLADGSVAGNPTTDALVLGGVKLLSGLLASVVRDGVGATELVFDIDELPPNASAIGAGAYDAAVIGSVNMSFSMAAICLP